MIKIIKFGGTIINNDKYLKNIYKIIDNELNDNNKLIIVVSAMGRDEEPYSTSKFTKLGSNLNEIDLAELLSYGERISSLVFLNSLISKNYKASVIRFEELGINLKGDYLKGELDYLENKKISDKLKDNNILIVPGFIGINNNKIGLLGKGGSDLTALYLAKMLNVKEIYLYKDVNGLMSGDPKVIVDCKTIEELSYDEALIFAQCGAQIVQQQAINEAKEFDIIIKVCSIIDLKEKTLISSSESNLIFKGIMSNDNYIYLISDNYKEYCDNICDILEKYNFECKDVVINPHFIRLELEGGKRNFAMNILHHYFISKNN